MIVGIVSPGGGWLQKHVDVRHIYTKRLRLATSTGIG